MKRYQTTFRIPSLGTEAVIGFHAENKSSADQHANALARDALIFPEGAVAETTVRSQMADENMGKRIDL